MDFEEYLKSKKIDSKAFQQAEPQEWQAWKVIFDEISPASFTAQKLYRINPIRRKYKLTAPASDANTAPPAAKPKPVFKPKIS